MDEELKQRLSRGDIWGRALYMIFFAIAYSAAEFVVTFLVIFQFFAILFTRQANEPLLKLGNNISTYIQQILRFQTFNTETKPFPFSSWPEEEVGDNLWLEDDSSADAQIDDAPEQDVLADDEPVDESVDESLDESDPEPDNDRPSR